MGHENEMTFHFQFEKIAGAMPDKIAIVFQNQSITFSELNKKANQLAHYLQTFMVGKETLIGVALQRETDLIIALLAISKVGGAFLMINTNDPIHRIQSILENSKLEYIVTKDYESSTNLAQSISSRNITLIDCSRCSEYLHGNLNLDINAGNLAYVMYTSGTTGRPKGVMIEHSGFVNTLLNQIQMINISSQDVILSSSSFTFDAFLWEIGGALLSGATIILATERERISVKGISQLIRHHKITIATFLPSILRLFNRVDLQGLKNIVSAGETCTPDLLSKIPEDCVLYNAYGPTESSICATMGKVEQEPVLIGKPLKNVYVAVLDHELMPVSIGEIGTLYIGGIGLARGYLNDEALTISRFINYHKHDIDRLYNSGDLVRIHANGELEFVERCNEIKILGNRISLGEIGYYLDKHPNIKSYFLDCVNGRNHRQKLVITVETNDMKMDLRMIRAYLGKYLPNYMLPTKLIKKMV